MSLSAAFQRPKSQQKVKPYRQVKPKAKSKLQSKQKTLRPQIISHQEKILKICQILPRESVIKVLNTVILELKN